VRLGLGLRVGGRLLLWLGLLLLGSDDRDVVLGDDDLRRGVDVLTESALDMVLPDHDGAEEHGDEAEGEDTQDHAPRTHGSPIMRAAERGRGEDHRCTTLDTSIWPLTSGFTTPAADLRNYNGVIIGDWCDWCYA
jgi:hypothetical protein